MDEERAQELFREYAAELNRSFYSTEELARMDGKCQAIADVLAMMKFYIRVVGFLDLQTELDPDGKMTEVKIIRHKLFLVTFAAEGRIQQVDYAETTTKFYDAPRKDPKEIVDELLSSLSSDETTKEP